MVANSCGCSAGSLLSCDRKDSSVSCGSFSYGSFSCGSFWHSVRVSSADSVGHIELSGSDSSVSYSSFWHSVWVRSPNSDGQLELSGSDSSHTLGRLGSGCLTCTGRSVRPCRSCQCRSNLFGQRCNGVSTILNLLPFMARACLWVLTLGRRRRLASLCKVGWF